MDGILFVAKKKPLCRVTVVSTKSLIIFWLKPYLNESNPEWNILSIYPSNSSLLKDLNDIELELCDDYFDMESEVITFKLPLLKMNGEAKDMFYRTELFTSPNIAYKIYVNIYYLLWIL